MKVYITADIEGVAGIAHSDECSKSHADYPHFRERMAREVSAACEGAFAAGAEEVVIKDAHGSGRNLRADELPRRTKLIRGWSGHPYGMVQELDERFAALVIVGYHSAASMGGNPLSHTFAGLYSRLELDGAPLSEFRVMSLTARSHGVPTVFLSGDAALCEDARRQEPGIVAVPTLRGVGASVISEHPEAVIEGIRSGVAEGLAARRAVPVMPERFRLDLRYRHHRDAYRFSFYPGAEAIADDTVRFESEDWFEVLRALRFAR
jgi:D-amino peptidase